MKRVFLGALCAGGLILFAAPALAAVKIHVDLDSQRMRVIKEDGESMEWKISSGREGYETPTGRFIVQRMDPDHHSDEYDQAPMPWSIFFSRGLAIHGTTERGLGRPLSHGCVRLSIPHAQELYSLVEQHGATIEITGDASGVVISGGVEEERPRRRRASRQPPVDSAFDWEARRFWGW